MAGSQKSATSFNMVLMRVEPSCLVFVVTQPCSVTIYSPIPELKLKAGRLSRKEQRRYMYLRERERGRGRGRRGGEEGTNRIADEIDTARQVHFLLAN